MFLTKIINIICPPPPKKGYSQLFTGLKWELDQVVIDDGKLHEVVIHPRHLVF